MAALPDATRASTVVCRSAAVRATHTTFASASASAVAYARPNPRDAPVTIVVCPWSFTRAYSDGILIVVAPAARDSRALLFRRLHSSSRHDFGGRLSSPSHCCHLLTLREASPSFLIAMANPSSDSMLLH